LDAGKAMGGGQWQVMRLIEGLASAGVESTLLARAGAPLFDAARGRGWRVEPIGLTRAVQFARQHDLIHAHDARSHTLATLLHGVPVVVARRVAFPIGEGPASQWKYRRARRFIAVSEFVKSMLVRAGVPEAKVVVIYDGVPILERNPAAESVLAIQKGASLAEEAGALARIPIKLVSDLERELPDAALFVYVSHSEGLGSGVLLAMSAGIPVVASRTGGLSEVIIDRQNGFLVENEAPAFAAAIRQLLDDPALARRIGTAARQAVRERFTVDHMVRRTMEVYGQVLS